MESKIDRTIENNEFDFCRHIKEHYYNSYILNLNVKPINSEEKINTKINLPNFFEIRNSFNIKNSLPINQAKNFYDNFFIRNINLSWMALYNPQNISLNSMNRDGCIFTISFDETGEILASSNHIHNIEIWDVKERKVKKVIKDHKEIVTGIEFLNNPNKNKNNNNKRDKYIKDLLKNKNFPNNENTFMNNLGMENENNQNELIDFDTLTYYSDLENDNPNEINLYNHENESPTFDNTYMMSCSLDKTIKLWKDFDCIHTFLDHNDWVRCLSISSDNKYFLSGCVSSVIKYWDLNEKKVLHSFNNSNDNPDLLNTVNSLNFMSNNINIFMTGLRSGSVKIFDVRNANKLVKEFKAHKFKLNSVKFNKDDKYLLSSGRDSVARLWDFRKLPVKFFDNFII